MCLPVQLLKCLVKFNAFATILVGAVAIATGVVVQVKTGSSSFFHLHDYNGNQIVNCLYIFGTVTIAFGIMGLIGGYKKKTCLLVIYNIGNVILMLTFLVLALVTLLFADKFTDLDEGDCTNSSWSSKVQITAAGASSSFCKVGCVCYIEQAVFPAHYLDNQGLLYTTNASVTNVTAYDQCPDFDTLPSATTDSFSFNIMSTAETLFSCSGWCTPQKIYQFSDINRGVPTTEQCFVEVTDWVHSNGQTIGAICLTIASIIFLTLIFTCCLMFHTEQRGESSIYKRMAYYDEL